MKRLYCLLPTIDSTHQIIDELHEMNIEDDCIHVVADDQSLLQKEHIHEADLRQTTDVIHSLWKGAIIGAAVGFVSAIVVGQIPSAGLTMGWSLYVILTAFGTLFGAWSSSMIGISVVDPFVQKYDANIKAGEFLMMIDVPHIREQKVAQIIQSHHPEATIESIKHPSAAV